METVNLLNNLKTIDVTFFIILLGSMIGSIKTSLVLDKNEPFCSRIFDIILGIFCGLMAGHYFSSNLNIYITGLIALLGGVCGTIIVEVTIELLPNAYKKVVNSYLKRGITK